MVSTPQWGEFSTGILPSTFHRVLPSWTPSNYSSKPYNPRSYLLLLVLLLLPGTLNPHKTLNRVLLLFLVYSTNLRAGSTFPRACASVMALSSRRGLKDTCSDLSACWVAAKELNLSYHIGEAPLITIYTVPIMVT